MGNPPFMREGTILACERTPAEGFETFAFLRNCPLPQPKPCKRLREQIVAQGSSSRTQAANLI